MIRKQVRVSKQKRSISIEQTKEKKSERKKVGSKKLSVIKTLRRGGECRIVSKGDDINKKVHLPRKSNPTGLRGKNQG